MRTPSQSKMSNSAAPGPTRALQLLATDAVPADFETSFAFATATWQATKLEPIGSGRGVTCEHFSIAYGHRHRKRHPSLGLITFGGSPVSAEIDSSFSRGSATAERRSWVYGCLGSRRTVSVVPASTRWPAYITM